MKSQDKNNFLMSLVPIVALIVVTMVLIVMFGMYIVTLALMIGSIVAGFVAVFYFKVDYNKLEKSVANNIGTISPAVLIMMTIGILSSALMFSGVVPSLMYYSLKIISPSIFLPTVAIVAAVVATATGSAFTSISTVGLALFFSGEAMGFSGPMLVGAIISGAMFGDKLSPLSDTTNISSMLAGTDLFTHIKNMLPDTLLAFFLALVVFGMIGFQVDASSTTVGAEDLLVALDQVFYISPFLAAVPLLLIVFAYMRFPIIPTLLLISCGGLLLGSTLQGFDFTQVLSGMFEGSVIVNGDSPASVAQYASLFNRGGLSSMSGTILIILMAGVFGGILRGAGMFEHILHYVSDLIKTPKSMVVGAILTAIVIAFSSGDQYLSILLPVDAFRERFKKFGIGAEHLSLAAETGGTVVIALVPYGIVGVFVSGLFSVSAFSFVPFIFFGFFTPVVTIVRVLLQREDKLLVRGGFKKGVKAGKVPVLD